MSHYFSEGGYTVIQIFGFRLQIVNRKKNPLLSQTVFPCYAPKEYRVGRFAISLSRV